MTRFSRFKTELSAFMLLIAVTACSTSAADVDGPATVGLGEGPTRITVLNESAVAITNLRILTSDSDSLPRISGLNPGQRSAEYRVQVAHTTPFVQATVGGRAISLHPVEGFSGFNPALPAGAYLMKLRFDASGQLLDFKMDPATP